VNIREVPIKYLFFLNAVKGKILNPNFCVIGDGSISVSYKGQILGCFQDFGHTSNIGHIEKDNLKKVIKNRIKLLFFPSSPD